MQRLSPRFRSEKYFVYKISEDFRTIVGRNVYRNLSIFARRRRTGAHLDGH